MGSDPEVHKVSKAMYGSASLILSVVLSYVCLLCPRTSLFLGSKKTATFFISHHERGEKISSYNHGKCLSFILNPSGFSK